MVDEYIENKQPFEIVYINSQEQQLIFNARFAQINFHKKHFYLNIWCDETDDISENDKKYFLELIHHRCLHFDRVTGIIHKSREWRESLDYMQVHLQFTGWMIKAYQPREDDIDDIVDGEFRKVIRKVFNPFWLVREIRGYGTNCEIIAPQGLRNYYRELIKMCQQYDL